MEENTRSGQNIGSAIEATDPDSNRLTYTLEGPGKDSFTVTSDGQIRTRSPLNYEERSRYSVTVKVNDGQRKRNSVAAQSVSITVLDRPRIAVRAWGSDGGGRARLDGQRARHLG